MARAKKAQSQSVVWEVFPSDFGPVLIAASHDGLCRIAFGEGEAELQALYPQAELQNGAADDADGSDTRQEWIKAAALTIAHPEARVFVPLALAGTSFQLQVWDALKHIPVGETRSYRQIAEAVGAPDAVRAVGTAIGANPVAVLIPCHRVVRSDGALGGYAWGLDIKRQLLAREARKVA